MKFINWDRTSKEQRKKLSKYKKTVILGSIDMSVDRIIQIFETYSVKNELLVWCLYKESSIDNLHGSQFNTLKRKRLDILKEKDKLITISIFQKDIKYLIREINPLRVIFINGSWQKTIHNRSEFWEVDKVGANIEYISPFLNVKESIAFTKQNNTGSTAGKDYMKLAEEQASKSFCWVFQNGAVIVKGEKVLVQASTIINPKDAYCMHNGCIREQLKLASGEELEKCMSTHAEQNAISIAAREGINISGSTLYSTTFPCGICAKAIAQSGIKEVKYKHPYGYKIGETIMTNIKLSKED